MRTAASRRTGASLIEILLAIIIVSIASVGTMTYFAYGMGYIGQSGNRRAAVERARERLEQLMAADASQLPAKDGQLHWCNLGNPCTAWVASVLPIAQTVAVENLGAQRIESSAQFVDDPSAGTATLDVYALGVKVWFIPGSTADDDLHRVHLRTLRVAP